MRTILDVILVFFASAILDSLAVTWTINVQDRSPSRAAIASMLIAIVGSTYLLVVDHRYLLIPAVMGHGAGVYLTLKYSNKKNGKNKNIVDPRRRRLCRKDLEFSQRMYPRLGGMSKVLRGSDGRAVL